VQRTEQFLTYRGIMMDIVSMAYSLLCLHFSAHEYVAKRKCQESEMRVMLTLLVCARTAF
jgi:hypothetical protein